MKHLLLLFIAITIGANCHAQTDFRFADSSAQWNIVVTNNYGVPAHTNHTTALADTFINGKWYQYFPGYISFLRRDSLKIYSWQDSLIYDFGAKTGDTIRTYTHNGYYGEVIVSVVQAVDTVNWGRLRRRLTLNSGVWVDGIGNLNSFPFDNCYGTQAQLEYTRYNVLCFFENGQLLFHSPDYPGCDYNELNGINNFDTDKRCKVYPNPADKFISIEFSEISNYANCAIELRDISGRLIYNTSVTGNSLQLPVQNLGGGIYFCSLLQQGRRISTLKLLVQH
ncbi:MAG: T9SS type A sorting domain-containing protein [Chitinophagales bacterium]